MLQVFEMLKKMGWPLDSLYHYQELVKMGNLAELREDEAFNKKVI